MQDVMEYKQKAKEIATNEYTHEELTAGEVIDIHNIVIDNMKIYQRHHYEDAYKVQDMPLLNKIVNKKYKTVEEKAGSLFFDITKKDAFFVGNIRTGVLASEVLLAKNGLQLGLTDEQIYNLALDITEEKIKKNDFISIFKTAVVVIGNEEQIDIKSNYNAIKSIDEDLHQFNISDYQ